MPQDRTGRFSTGLFERYQRWERALVAALAEMWVDGMTVAAHEQDLEANLRDLGTRVHIPHPWAARTA